MRLLFFFPENAPNRAVVQTVAVWCDDAVLSRRFVAGTQYIT